MIRLETQPSSPISQQMTHIRFGVGLDFLNFEYSIGKIRLKAIVHKIQQRIQCRDLRISLWPLGVLSWMSIITLLRLIHNISNDKKGTLVGKIIMQMKLAHGPLGAGYTNVLGHALSSSVDY